MGSQDLDDYVADFITETEGEEGAILVDFGNDEEIWVPKEHILYKVNDNDGTVKITMPEWLALDKGAI